MGGWFSKYDVSGVIVNLTWAKQPAQFLPVAGNVTRAEMRQRNMFYGKTCVFTYLITVAAGTGIMLAGPVVKEHLGRCRRLRHLIAPSDEAKLDLIPQDQEEANQPSPESSTTVLPIQMKFVIGIVFVAEYGVNCAAVIWSVRSDRISKLYGLDWELYQGLLALNCTWLLVQAGIAIVLLKPGGRYGVTSFIESSIPGTAPFLSDAFDTLRDVIFGGLCLKSEKLGIQMLGWASLLYLLGAHLYFLYDSGCANELMANHLSVLTAHAKEDDVEDRPIWMKIVMLLYKQTTPVKRTILEIENTPQAVGALVFTCIEGGSLYVTFINILVPLAQLALGLYFYKSLQRCVVPMIQDDWRRAAHAANELRIAHYRELCRDDPDLFCDLILSDPIPNGEHASFQLKYSEPWAPGFSTRSSIKEVKEVNLDLEGSGMTDAVGKLRLPEQLYSLHLNLYKTKVTDAFAERLRLPGQLNSLFLNLGATKVANALAERLRLPEQLKSLRLNLSETKVADAFAERLRLPEQLNSLHLNLYKTEITDAFAERLRLPEQLKSLRLDLGATKVADAFAERLRLPEQLNSLCLDLYKTEITDAFAERLRLQEQLNSLFLDLSCTSATDAFAERLRLPEQLQKLELWRHYLDGPRP